MSSSTFDLASVTPGPASVLPRHSGTGTVRRRRRLVDLSHGSGFDPLSWRYEASLVLADAFVGLGVFTITRLLGDLQHVHEQAPVGLVGLVWPVLIALLGGYNRRRIGVGTRELREAMRAGLWLIVLGAYPATIMNQQALFTLLLVTAPLCVLLSLLARLLARHHLHRLQRGGDGCRRTLAVGPADAVASLQARLEREPHSGMRVEAACIPVGAGPELNVPVLGQLDEVRRVVDEGCFDAVAVTGGQCMNEDYLRHLAWSLEGADVELLIAPGLAEIVAPRLEIRPLVGVPLLAVRQPRFSGWQLGVKRTMDIALTSIGLVVISPLMLAVAAGIKLQDGGPVLFRQTRIGRGGQPFELLKFRSMVVDAEARKAALMARNEGHGGLFKLRDDPRVTPLGQFIRDWSLDELPQLFNVLSGSMSLVGPRPHLAEELAVMPADSVRRSLVVPGVTGLWQISGRSDLPGSDGLRLDLRYVENWSIALDLHIIWKTFRAVLARSGAR